MEIVSLPPKGFCEGVAKAFLLTEKAKKENEGKTIYLIGSLVHNDREMAPLLDDGFKLLDERNGSLEEQMEDLPFGSVVIYSAHGHSKEKYDEIAKRKGFKVYDASCGHVLINLEKMKNAKGKVAFIASENHLEGKAAKDIRNVTIIDPKKPIIGHFDYAISQTSLDEDQFMEIFEKLKAMNPNIVSLSGRCPSSVLRQETIIKADSSFDLFIVIGSKESSNTSRLAYLAKKYHKNADVIQVLDVDELKKRDLGKYKKAALCSGASSSKAAYEEIEDYLRSL